MPLIQPQTPTLETLQPHDTPCHICKRALYWQDQGIPCSLVIPSKLLSPETTEQVLKLLDAHNTAMWVKDQITGTTPYYVIITTSPSWQASFPLCNDCWEHTLLDIIGLTIPEDQRGTIRLILTDHKKWGKDQRSCEQEDSAGCGGS